MLELNNVEAKEFLMDSKSYVTFDLPEYFDFTQLLEKVDTTFGSYERVSIFLIKMQLGL